MSATIETAYESGEELICTNCGLTASPLDAIRNDKDATCGAFEFTNEHDWDRY